MPKKGETLGPRVTISWGSLTRKVAGKKTTATTYSKVPGKIATLFGLKAANVAKGSSGATVKKDKKGRRRLVAPTAQGIGANYLMATVDGKTWHRVRIPQGVSLAQASTVLRSGRKVYAIKFPNGQAKQIGTKSRDTVSKSKAAATAAKTAK
jgi:hypothetical protein